MVALADVEANARQMAASIQELAFGQTVVEDLLAFAIGGCAEEFARCFDSREWLAVEMTTMMEEWRCKAPTGESGTYLLR